MRHVSLYSELGLNINKINNVKKEEVDIIFCESIFSSPLFVLYNVISYWV